MRTLTLGVLIVAGGTLAALPFRRFSAPPDASQGPLQATGPVLSELDTMPRVYPAASTGIADPAAAAGEPAPLQQLVESLPRWNQPTMPREARRVDIPLTFDDLAAPIEFPQPLQERFTAVASVHQQRLQDERMAVSEPPSTESMVAASTPRFGPLATVTEDSSDPALPLVTPAAPVAATPPTTAPRAAASLASTARSEVADPLPKPVQPVREKHWIRQP